MLQNLKTIQLACIVFFCLNLAIRVFTYLVPARLTHINNYPEFSTTNWICLLLTPVFYIIGYQLITQYGTRRNSMTLSMLYVIIFCLYLLICGMFFNFIATSDPSSSIIIYLVALIAVAGVYTLEYQESILITVVNAVAFTLLLMYVRADPTEILYNELLLVVLSVMFFFISRHIYSYRTSHYLQFKVIKEKTRELEKASAFKNDVLGMVAHDLRNPIAAIESIALLTEMDELDEDIQENMSMIKISCRKALAIINDLLEVARNDNSNETNHILVNLNDFLKGIVHLWQHVNDFNNDLILITPAHAVHGKINPEKFQRVIDNLISNAAKFSKDKAPIELRLTEQNQYVRLEIKDKGMGIPPALLPQIFDRFSKAGRKGLKGEKSTGLGLSISKQIVESHYGHIDVQSTEGEGTTFIISLPRVNE